MDGAFIRAAVVTNFPSYHQVELFNVLARSMDLKVFYLRTLPPGRQWSKLKNINHKAEFIQEWRVHRHFYLNPGALRRIHEFRPDCLVVTQYASIAMQALMYKYSVLRKPWIYWSEAPGVEYTELPIFRSECLRRIARKMALTPLRLGPRQVWGIGKRATDAYKSWTQTDCINVPYYSDQEPFRKIERRSHQGVVRFLYCGKLVHRKSLDVLLRATEQLSAENEEFRLIVVGDGPERKRLGSLSSAALSRTDYLGFKELEVMPSVYASADVLVFPSRYDGWGMALVEGMASGMPVISTPGVGAALDYLKDGQNGFSYPAEDGNALAERMKFFLRNRCEIFRFGERARRDVSALDVKKGASRIESLLKSAVREQL